MFKTDDRVKDSHTNLEGVVIYTDGTGPYPIVVSFGNNIPNEYYTTNGSFLSDTLIGNSYLSSRKIFKLWIFLKKEDSFYQKNYEYISRNFFIDPYRFWRD